MKSTIGSMKTRQVDDVYHRKHEDKHSCDMGGRTQRLHGRYSRTPTTYPASPIPPPPPPPPPTPPPARTTDATKETHDDKRSASKNMSKAFAVPACRVLEVADEGSNKFVEQLHATSYPLIVSGGS